MSKSSDTEDGEKYDRKHSKQVAARVSDEAKERVEQKVNDFSEPGDMWSNARLLRYLIQEKLDDLEK